MSTISDQCSPSCRNVPISPCNYLFYSSFHGDTKTNSRKNERLNLNRYISTSICQTFSNDISLCPSLFAVQYIFSFFLILFLDVFYCLLNFTLVKNTWKIDCVTIFWHYRWVKQNFENLSHCFVTTSLLFKRKISHPVSDIYGCRDIWLQVLASWIENGMSFSKLLFGMINNKNEAWS